MNITVFGASGSVGSLVVEQALARGHRVTAVTRSADRVAMRHDLLRVVEADVSDPGACAQALDGTDGVLVVLGDGSKGAIREVGTRAVVAAMQQSGVDRLVCMSTMGVGSSRANLNFVWKYLMFGGLLRRAYADHVRQEAVVEGSGLDWTIVRPSAFADQSPGAVRHGFGPHEPGLKFKIGRSDLASFLVDRIEERTHLRAAVSVSS